MNPFPRTISEVEVLVAGFGAAGACVALALAEFGHEVLLIDRNRRFRQSSSTSMSSGMIVAAGSRVQQEAGVDDSPLMHLSDILAKSSGDNNDVARALTMIAPDVINWLTEKWNVPFELVTDAQWPGLSRARSHALPARDGADLLGRLAALVMNHPKVSVAVPLELVDVSFTRSRIFAATLLDPRGDEESIRVGAVVMCTGGFGANSALVKRHLPTMVNAHYFGSEDHVGTALLVGERHNLDMGALNSFQGHGAIAASYGLMVTWSAVMRGGVLLNRKGQRFGDETIGYSDFGPIVHSQPDGDAFVVIDGNIHQQSLPFPHYRALSEMGGVKWCETAGEMSEVIGAPASVIETTMRAAKVAANGARDALGRTNWEHPLSAPFGVIKVKGALVQTQGGLQTDVRGRVLGDGKPIGGLYAAGCAAAGISGAGSSYLAGNGLLAAVGLGYLSARDCSRYLTTAHR